MKTTLTAERLAELHALVASKPEEQFVDPVRVACVRRIIMERGEDWVSSVLMRALTARSRLNPNLPWLHAGELEIVQLADDEEWKLLSEAAGDDR